MHLFGRRKRLDFADFQLRTMLIREDAETQSYAIQIVEAHRLFKRLLMTLPSKKKQVPWDGPEIAIDLAMRAGSIPTFLLEVPASILRIAYYFERLSKPKFTGTQVYQMWMKKNEDFARRQAALTEVINLRGADPWVLIGKMDSMIVTFCAPYYEMKPAFVKVMELWRSIVANFRAIHGHPELGQYLLTFHVDFVYQMIVACSFGSKDVPENFVFVTVNQADPLPEVPEYEYEP